MQLAFHSDRKNCEDSYKQIFKSQKSLSKIQDSTNNSEKSRLSKSPRSYRNNDIESYFLQSIYVPYAESLLGQMSERFEDQKNDGGPKKCQSLWNLIPKYTVSLTSSETTCRNYINKMLIAKLSLFQKLCAGKKKGITTLPTNVINAWQCQPFPKHLQTYYFGNATC